MKNAKVRVSVRSSRASAAAFVCWLLPILSACAAGCVGDSGVVKSRLGDLHRNDLVVVNVDSLVTDVRKLKTASTNNAAVAREAVEAAAAARDVADTAQQAADAAVARANAAFDRSDSVASDAERAVATANSALAKAEEALASSGSGGASSDALAAVSNRVDILSNNVAVVSNRVDALARGFVSSTNDIASVSNRVDTLSSNVAAVSNRVDALMTGFVSSTNDIARGMSDLTNWTTNNYLLIETVSQRAKSLEAWQYTNSVSRIDMERGVTDWAVTPMWPLGRVVVLYQENEWRLCRPGGTQVVAGGGVVRSEEYGMVTAVDWEDVTVDVPAKWTNELDRVGVAWTHSLDSDKVVARFTASARRITLVRAGDVKAVSDRADEALEAANAAQTAADNALAKAEEAKEAAAETKSDVDPLLFARYYPGGNVKSAAEFTPGIKYDEPVNENRTITVGPFCRAETVDNDNSGLAGRVVIPPFVDASGNGYISDDGTRFKVVGLSGDDEIIGSNANLTDIIVPNTVTTIGRGAFNLCYSLASVSLPAATNIGARAFYDCNALASVSLPAAATIGDYAFFDCDSLTSVSLPAVATIGRSVFNRCQSLVSVSLPTVTTIGESAFHNCGSLASVSLPAATTIWRSAFHSCQSLVSVSLPAATTIWEAAFKHCEALASVSLPAATTVGDYGFASCVSLASISLPSATAIKSYAFANCYSLAAVSLPAATTIGATVFGHCEALTFVDFGAAQRSSVPTLGTDAFYNASTSCKIIVPTTQYDDWVAATGWSGLVTAGYKFLRHSEWEYARKYEIPKPPVYDGNNHYFFEDSENTPNSPLKGFKAAGTPHRWTAPRQCVVYMRMTGGGSTESSVVYVHVNNVEDMVDATTHLLFKQSLKPGIGLVVPVHLSAGDSLDIMITGNNLSNIQYSVFYVD